MRRYFWRFALSFSCSVSILAAAVRSVCAQPDPHLTELDVHALMGTWECRGSDAGRKPLHARMEWGFNDGGGFYFMLEPKPVSATHEPIAEQWEWDAVSAAWRAIPDAGTAEQAQFSSRGWSGQTLVWVRMAAESTMDRAFVRNGPDRLTFRSERAILGSGAGPVRHHVFYQLACRRTVTDAPR